VDKLRRVFFFVNAKSVIVTVFALLSTYLCRRFNLLADFPLTIITTAVIFPIVFSIGGAYKRRENALREYGSIKAHGRAIFFAARDWPQQSDEETKAGTSTLLGDLLKACRKLFTEPIDNMPSNEESVYKLFSQLSNHIISLRNDKGLASGEASRCNQYLSKMILAFESVKHIYQYRTPRALRLYSDIFIVVLPILYGPYFASISQDFSRGLEYLLPILFSVVLVTLDQIQEHLENPFDQIGEDDVVINAEKFVSRLEL
jgi:predicted membrane chloride channel (bestrophin family)